MFTEKVAEVIQLVKADPESAMNLVLPLSLPVQPESATSQLPGTAQPKLPTPPQSQALEISAQSAPGQTPVPGQAPASAPGQTPGQALGQTPAPSSVQQPKATVHNVAPAPQPVPATALSGEGAPATVTTPSVNLVSSVVSAPVSAATPSTVVSSTAAASPVSSAVGKSAGTEDQTPVTSPVIARKMSTVNLPQGQPIQQPTRTQTEQEQVFFIYDD